MVALTIGMATYNDFDGVYFSVQALRMYQDIEDTELIVVDNYGCEITRKFIEEQVGGRYILAKEVTGTAAPRDLVFREAVGDAVLCLDSHVLFAPRAIEKLKAYYRDHPTTIDLLQGPLLFDSLDGVSTHFDTVWRSQMWGHWATDPRGITPDLDPFEIPNMGLGSFSCRREVWPGFNSAFRGFGGEEGYLHEKFRQAGGQALCLPFLQWAHRFGRPNGVPYPIYLRDKFRNHIIGHDELGLDLVPILTHFREVMSLVDLKNQTRSALTDVYGDQLPRDMEALFSSLDQEEAAIVAQAAESASITDTPAPVQTTPLLTTTPAPQPGIKLVSKPAAEAPFDSSLPLVSCLCPTYNRVSGSRWVLEEAIESFLRQDYPNKELIVLNDCAGQVLVCDSPNVRVVNFPQRFATAADKRAAMVKLSRGSFLAPWEDDTVSLPERISFALAQEVDEDEEVYRPGSIWWFDSNGVRPQAIAADDTAGILFTRETFDAIGDYPVPAQHASLVQEDSDNGRVPGEASPEERHLIRRESLAESNDAAIIPGRYLLAPGWSLEYGELVRLGASSM